MQVQSNLDSRLRIILQLRMGLLEGSRLVRVQLQVPWSIATSICRYKFDARQMLRSAIVFAEGLAAAKKRQEGKGTVAGKTTQAAFQKARDRKRKSLE